MQYNDSTGESQNHTGRTGREDNHIKLFGKIRNHGNTGGIKKDRRGGIGNGSI